VLEKPSLPDALLLSALQRAYGLPITQIAFLPIGADANTAVYRALDQAGTAYFVKLRSGDFNEISVSLPRLLKDQGLACLIAPLATVDGRLWADLEAGRLILYPYIAGVDAYQRALTDAQWQEFGAALQAMHSVKVPPALANCIPGEDFSPKWREMVKSFQARLEKEHFDDPTAAELAAEMRRQRPVISRLLAWADELARSLQIRPLEPVLCHTDIHAGNLHLPSDGAAWPVSLYIVDWDNPCFAPKECDLAMIGGSRAWSEARQQALFYQGYGQVEIDRLALAYYRCERVIQDLAVECEQILRSTEDSLDRPQSLRWFKSNFTRGGEIELALSTK
jgi:spectinomycin phosphotransferase